MIQVAALAVRSTGGRPVIVGGVTQDAERAFMIQFQIQF